MALIVNPTKSKGICFAFIERDLILRKDGCNLDFNDLRSLKETLKTDSFIEEKEYNYCALYTNQTEVIPEEYERVPIRSYLAEKEEKEILLLSRAKAISTWINETKFCERCGNRLSIHKSLSAQECSHCKKLIFPRIEPCIIVLVKKGNEILLAKHTQRNQNVYACIAGFMEAGETPEQTVLREVKEETGICVKNICYRGGQSWPFPSQLMLAFTAEYESGEIKIQEDELSDAQWFRQEDNPATPPPGSIAYRLIHDEI